LTQPGGYQQQEQGWMVYPRGHGRRFIFKLPIYLWRLGLARLNPPNFLLLTTFGRKSGLPRRTMLESACINGRFYLASGWGKRPHWVRNAQANPLVTVQTVQEGAVHGRVVPVTDEDEVRTLFHHMQGNSPVWNDFLASWGIADDADDFVAKKERLTILRVEPVEPGDPIAAQAPPPLKADLVWVGPVLVALLGLFVLLRAVRRKAETP